MFKLFVDSGASIKKDELEKYNVGLLPLMVSFEGEEYYDGLNLSMEEFYHHLIDLKQFPKTSTPNLVYVEEQVNSALNEGLDVIILTLSSGISSTFNTLKSMFIDNDKVKVIDSKVTVGAHRLLVEMINRNRDKSLDEIEQLVNEMTPKIKVVAVPKTLEYLYRGGRLSKSKFVVANLLSIKPIITIKDGEVVVDRTVHGANAAFKFVANSLDTFNVDLDYPIVGAYTKYEYNLNKLIELTDPKYHQYITVRDDISPVIASHLGDGVFAYIFVTM